ncbi:hypothetical protein [Holdemanella biformis]|jgi:AAA15 family ATPase/GTPase|uniref:ATP-binding protein n=1 Tax=Holdemanella biformis TaxID=1735 RepID=A0A412IWP8_9FIRM|nr:hypothetical protein [Holdemanella biformis]RGS44601.1 hypothetical protein DWX92_10405 [Holdemanella biformis]
MLIGMKVQNFTSFNDLTAFSMVASNKLRKQKERLYESDAISLLKSTVIYGSNVSSKSNFVEVLRFIKECVINPKISIESYNWYCRNHEDNRENIIFFSSIVINKVVLFKI